MNEKDSWMSPRNIILTVVILAALAIVLTILFRPFQPDGHIAAEDSFVHGAVADIGVRFDSSLRRLGVKPGDRVRWGDVLAELEDRHLLARVQEQRAEVARREAELEAARIAVQVDDERARLSLDLAGQEARAARAALQSARATADLARREFARSERLFAEGIVPRARVDASREQLETSEADLREAEAEFTAARRETDLADADIQRIDVLQAELRASREALAVSQAELENAEADLDAAMVRAPHSGMIVDVSAREGASVRPNDTILSMWIEGELWIHAWVPENDVSRLAPGTPAMIRLPALDGSERRGHVIAVLVAPDGEQQSLPGRPVSPLLPDRPRFAVRIALDGPDQSSGLLPGMSADVTLMAAHD